MYFACRELKFQEKMGAILKKEVLSGSDIVSFSDMIRCNDPIQLTTDRMP